MKRTHGEEDDDDDHPSKRARIEAPPPVEGPSYFDVTCADIRALVRRQWDWKERTLFARTCKQAHQEECYPLLPLMTFLQRMAELVGLDPLSLRGIYNRWFLFAPNKDTPLRFYEANQPTAVYAVNFSAGAGTAMHLQVFPCVRTKARPAPTPQSFDQVLHLKCTNDPHDMGISFVIDPFATRDRWTYISRTDADGGRLPAPSSALEDQPNPFLQFHDPGGVLLIPILDLPIPGESDDEGHDDHA